MILAGLAFVSCASNAASAEEYFSIGMAYFDLGKFTEAEQWLTRASQADRTQTASAYNLGRIAFETGRYHEAAVHFEKVLARDPNNVMALKAAAYTRIRTGDLEMAETFYSRVLSLVPESSDDGYNYAIVLYAVGKYENCERVLLNYSHALDDKPDSLLLLARAQKAQNRIEAIDNYAKWIAGNTASNPRVFHEYGQALENAQLYAMALEQYRQSLSSFREDLPDLKRGQVQFDVARLLLIADPGNPEGIVALRNAVSAGFNNRELLEDLYNDSRIDSEQRNEVWEIYAGLS